MSYTLEYAMISDRGKLRRSNQDNFLCRGEVLPMEHSASSLLHGEARTDQPAVFGVFDGMGGEQHGEAASFLAAETARENAWDSTPASAFRFTADANRKICAFTRENGLDTCGTTACVLCFEEEQLLFCNIGDSRIYRIAEDGMTRLSKDHALPSYPGGRKGALLQFLGIPEDEMRLEPHVGQSTIQNHDSYLLCTDGLTDMVPEEQIYRTIANHRPADAVNKLVEAALSAGGKDNITLALIRCRAQRRMSPQRWLAQLLGVGKQQESMAHH